MSHGGGGERWLVSYADFITLLMVMFVVLYSMGQTDIKKYKELAQGFKAAFSLGGVPKVVDPQIDQSGGLSPDSAAAPIVIQGLPMTTGAGAEVAGQLSDLLSKNGLSSEVSIQNSVEGVLISLSEKLVFIEGKADLQPSSYPVLDTIVTMLKPLENEIKVIGHTDNTPPLDARFANNWELSVARANKILEYFLSKEIQPQRLIATGRGEFQPIFPNDTPEHRKLNSRADIVVVYPVSSDVIRLDLRNLPVNPQPTTVPPPASTSHE